MRAEGNVVNAGNPTTGGLGLPMEEREDRDAVRARMEAKRARSSSPWAGRAIAGDLAPDSKVVKKARSRAAVDPARDRELFESKPLVADQAPAVVEPVVQMGHAPEHIPALVDGPVIDERPEPAGATAPAPRQAPRPTPAPVHRVPARTPRAHREFDAAGIVQDYLAGKTVLEIARERHHGVQRVRELIKSTPGVEYRDDRKIRSGSSKKDYDPAVVAAVRRLYVDEGLTQAQVAERLRLGTSMVVQTIMSRYDIPSRGAAVASGATNNQPGRSTIEHLRQQIADAGLTAGELRAWAREHGHTVAPTGLPGTEILAAYKVAQAAPVVDQVVDVAPETALTAPPARQLTPEQQQAAEALARAITDAFLGLARTVTGAVEEIVKALAHTPAAQDDYALVEGPE